MLLELALIVAVPAAALMRRAQLLAARGYQGRHRHRRGSR